MHLSMTAAWVYAVLGAALIADRPVEVLVACVFIVLVPFTYIAMIEEMG